MDLISPADLERYSRQLPLIGEEGQARLAAGKVLIIGAGGLGSPAALYLAAAGVGTIAIADPDAVERSNLQRQILHSTATLGRAKVESARSALLALNPACNILALPIAADKDNIASLIAPYDFIIEATDNFETKFLVNDACVLGRKPFSHGGIMGFRGQTMTYVPGEGPCYRCIFPSPPPPGAVPPPAKAGVLGPVAGIIGSIQASQAIKFLVRTGPLLTGSLFVYDALADEARKLPLPRSVSCPLCRKGGGRLKS